MSDDIPNQIPVVTPRSDREHVAEYLLSRETDYTPNDQEKTLIEAAIEDYLHAARPARKPSNVHVIFDGPPSYESGRFVDIENDAGSPINIGDWFERPDGLWDLTIPVVLPAAAGSAAAMEDTWKIYEEGLRHGIDIVRRLAMGRLQAGGLLIEDFYAALRAIEAVLDRRQRLSQ